MLGMDRKEIPSILVVVLGAALSGCASLYVGAGATVVTAAAEERGLGSAATDLAIAANIHALWLKYDADLVAFLDTTVSEGRVLLTGTAPNQQARIEAVRLTWRTPGVEEVQNEIEVKDAGGIASYARDTWITTQLVTKLTFDQDIQSINYSVETANSVVYLMGIAQNQTEIERVRNHARNLRYVRRVVSHIRLKDDPRRKGQ